RSRSTRGIARRCQRMNSQEQPHDSKENHNAVTPAIPRPTAPCHRIMRESRGAAVLSGIANNATRHLALFEGVESGVDVIQAIGPADEFIEFEFLRQV